MPRGERSHVHHQSINLDPDIPLWNHSRDFPKRADASWAPDNPFSGHNGLKQQHNASRHRAMSQSCVAQDCKKTQIFFNAHEHRDWASHKELTAKDFTWAVSKLVGCYTNAIAYDSRQLR
jgi:hypothetical protein